MSGSIFPGEELDAAASPCSCDKKCAGTCGRETGANETPGGDPEVSERHEIYNSGRYRAVMENLGFMWRWRIWRDNEMCQEGCSLSGASSREAVGHVLAFYHIRDSNAGEGEPGSP